MDAPPIIKIGGYNYPTYDLFVIAVGIVAAVVLWAAIYHTQFGVLLRATSQDRRMASALGLNVGLVFVVGFGIGWFLVGGRRGGRSADARVGAWCRWRRPA